MRAWVPNSQCKRKLKRIQKQPISAVFNYSDLTFTKGMWEVLNKGLKFAILQPKLNITQLLVDFRKFGINLVWKEFFFGKYSDEDYKPKLFGTNKFNIPKNHKTPKGLKTFFGVTKSDILDPRNRKKCKKMSLRNI